MATNDNHFHISSKYTWQEPWDTHTGSPYIQPSPHKPIGPDPFDPVPGIQAQIQTILEVQNQILEELRKLTEERDFYRIRCEELEKILDASTKV